MDQLFESAPDEQAAESQAHLPLAARMRPRSVDELVGQRQLIKPGSALHEALTGKAPHSMILVGPPGTGKTTIARLVANAADAACEERSAVVVGRPEAVAVIEQAGERLRTSGRRTVFFLDEIHRFNKAQQDALLPAVEDGRIILIGATTENPYFEVNAALLSRCRLYALEPLKAEEVRGLLERAVTDQRGLGGRVETDPDALEFLAVRSGGDARTALTALELAAELAAERGGRRPRRPARGASQPGSGRHLYGARTQEQRQLHGIRGSRGRNRAQRRAAPAPPPARPAHPRRPRVRQGRGLRVPPRPPRRIQRAAAAARGQGRLAVLRAGGSGV
jgi:putative ATPase